MNPEFNFEKSAAAAQVGIDRSYESALEIWKEKAHAALWRVANRGEEFTVDDIWIELDKDWTTFRPREPRAMGGVLRNAARSGLIIQVGYAKTAQVSGHRHPISKWRKK